MALNGGISIDLSFIRDVEDHFKLFPKAIEAAFPIALNASARQALKIGAKEMLDQVNFPPGYLNEPERFYISQFATVGDNPSAIVSARSRGTSLYRFAVGNPTPQSSTAFEDGGQLYAVHNGKVGRPKLKRRRVGVTVEIKKGHPITLGSAFVVNFNGNMQIAIRLKNGQFPAGLKRTNINVEDIGNGLFVLYGPSVDQVFGSSKDGKISVRQKIAPEIMEYAKEEMRRQFFIRLGK